MDRSIILIFIREVCFEILFCPVIWFLDTSWTAPGKFYTMEEYQRYYSQYYSTTAIEGYADYSQQFYKSEAANAEPSSTLEPTKYEPERKRPKTDGADPEDRKHSVNSEADQRGYPSSENNQGFSREEEDDEGEDDAYKLGLTCIKEGDPEEEKESVLPQRSAGGLLGPWVPVVHEDPPPVNIKEEKV